MNPDPPVRHLVLWYSSQIVALIELRDTRAVYWDGEEGF